MSNINNIDEILEIDTNIEGAIETIDNEQNQNTSELEDSEDNTPLSIIALNMSKLRDKNATKPNDEITTILVRSAQENPIQEFPYTDKCINQYTNQIIIMESSNSLVNFKIHETMFNNFYIKLP